MSTLIVRDATLAVNGAPETRGQASEHLAQRVCEVAGMESTIAADCIEVLQPSMGTGEECDLEVLLALTVLGLAKPELASERDLSVVSVGRRLAARLEEQGDAVSALSLVERLREEFPTHGALERDCDAILGRLGMVQDLAERYFQRAERLAQEGNSSEAVGWLREVLLLDGGRSDAARMIRDLRLNQTRRGRPRPAFSRLQLIGLLGIVGLLGGVVREVGLRREFRALPEANLDSLVSAQERLASIEAFQSEHPVWHGALGALAERSDLRVQVKQLERVEAERQAIAKRDLQERYFEAEMIQRRAVMHVEAEDFEAALADYREALRVAPESWAARDRVERDVAAVVAHMGEIQQ